MPGSWFIGDLHFGHEKVAALRGFAETGLHDLTIQHKWRRQVAEDDIVYVLGDLSSGSTSGELRALGIIELLPGRKRLVSGNHDSVSSIHRRMSPNMDAFRHVFESIQDFGRIRIEREEVLMSHYPYKSQGDGPGRGITRYEQFRLPDLGAPLIHAHTHHSHPFNGSAGKNEMCVSWDAWKRLVNLGDVQRWLIDRKEARNGTR